jgi:aromatic ring-opening dioxygenase LigB subunit
MLKFAAITPHPPIIIPTIGKPSDLEKISKTIEGMKKLAKEFSKAKPETVILISPHGLLDSDEITISKSPTFVGNFYHFGDFDTEFVFNNNLDLVEKIEKAAKEANIPIKTTNIKNLDHGTLVPLYYLTQGQPDIKLVTLTFSFLDSKIHFKFGQILKKVISDKGQETKIAIVASGDLSHRLTPDAPAGFSPRGKEFDQKIVKLLKEKDVKGILNLDKTLLEEAGECGYRSIVILLGVLDNLDWKPEILSYEAPFGVGYMVINFNL